GGMKRLGARVRCGVEDVADAQQASARRRGTDRHRLVGVENVQRGAIGFGVNGDRRIAELATRADDAHGDLSAVGDEDFHGAGLYRQNAGRMRRMTEAATTNPITEQRLKLISGVIETLLADLTSGSGDKDRRRQVEEWLRTLAEKYPEFKIEVGLRDYYLAEAERLRAEFDKAPELAEKLALARSIEGVLDRAADYDRRITERWCSPICSRLPRARTRTCGAGQSTR